MRGGGEAGGHEVAGGGWAGELGGEVVYCGLGLAWVIGRFPHLGPPVLKRGF